MPPTCNRVKCDICLGLLIEPVTLPCSHEICYSCYQQVVDQCNLSCPFCRKRISVWSRRAVKLNSLINEKRWLEICDMLPDTLVEKLMNKNQTVTDDDFNMADEPIKRMISESGDIGLEFKQFMDREMEQRRIEKEREEEMSRQFILKHFSDESERQLMEQQDEEYARSLQQAEVDDSKPSDAAGRRKLTRTRTCKRTIRRSKSRTTSRRPAATNPAGGDA